MTQQSNYPSMNYEIVVFYDTRNTGVHAKKVCDILGNFCVSPRFFLFDIMDIDYIRDEALSIADNSQLVIVVAKNPGDVPAPLLRWLNTNTDDTVADFPVAVFKPKAAAHLPSYVREELIHIASPASNRLQHVG